MGYKQPQARWMVVTDRMDANGHIHEELTIIDGPELPWRISKRQTYAQRMGIQYIRSLHNRKPWHQDGIRAVSVCDGVRELRSWRFMEGQGGYTGTHDVHPLIAQQLR